MSTYSLLLPLLAVGTLFFIRNPLWRLTSIAVAVVPVVGVADIVLSRFFPGLAGAIWWAIACAAPLGFAFTRWYARNLALVNQGNRATIASTAPLINAHIDARSAQAKHVSKDTTPFLRLGTARGVFTGKQDPYSPDAGLPFGLSVEDLSTHLIVLGSTGSGKTTGTLIPLVAQYLGWSTEESRMRAEGAAGGLVVLDPKGSLPGAFKGLKDYLFIEPGNDVRLGLIEGLEPSDVVLAFMTVSQSQSHDKENKFFQTAAGQMLQHVGEFLRALVDVQIEKFGRDSEERPWRWTLHDVKGMCTRAQRPTKLASEKMDAYIKEVEDAHPDARRVSLLSDAIEYLTIELPSMDEKTRSNIWGTLSGWLVPCTSHKLLKPYSNTEFGVSLDRVFFGGAMGINTPETTYGVGGKLTQCLVKQRLYAHIRRRGSYDWKAAGETGVLFLIDEAGELSGKDERTLLPVGRGLGARMCFAAQNKEAFITQFGGEHEANGFLDNFRSAFVSQSSHATHQWMQHRLGQTMSLVPQGGGGHVAFELNARLAAEGPINSPDHEGSRLFRLLARQGAGGTTVLHRGKGLGRHGSAEGLSLDKLALTTTGVVDATFQLQPLLLDSELDAYTSEQFCAIAQVNRGRHRRRDAVRMTPMYQLPRELFADGYEPPAAQTESVDDARVIPTIEPVGESPAARVSTPEPMRNEPEASPELVTGFDAHAMFGPRGYAGSRSPNP